MLKMLGSLLLLVAVSAVAFATDSERVPEIDANSAATAVALVSGALLVLRSKRK